MEIFEQFIILIIPFPSDMFSECRVSSSVGAVCGFQKIISTFSQFRQSNVVVTLTRQQHRDSLHYVDGIFLFRETGVVECPSVILQNVNS